MDHVYMMSKLVLRGKPEMQPAPVAKILVGSFHLGRTASHRSHSSRSSSITHQERYNSSESVPKKEIPDERKVCAYPGDPLSPEEGSVLRLRLSCQARPHSAFIEERAKSLE